MNSQSQQSFLYLYERVGEPLYFSPRGSDNNAVIYNVPTSTMTCSEMQDAAEVTRKNFGSSYKAKTVIVSTPKNTPNLSNIAKLCPRSVLFNSFNPLHRQAMKELRELMLAQTNLDDLLSVASTCRDSPMINCKLWINAYTSCMLSHPMTKNFRLPAIWEVMPDQFFSPFCLRQAFRQAEMPSRDRGVIVVDQPRTGSNINPENRLAYWREDVGINNYHWHWHLVYRIDDPAVEGRRKGEMFYYMHHAIIARYNAERLGNHLSRVRPLSIDDNPTIKEGYFGKLFDTNSGQNWGTRQNDTPLRNLNREGDTKLPAAYRFVTLEQLRKWRDRVMEAIDTGLVNATGNRRVPLTVDNLGDLMEASTLSLNPQFYGPEGLHAVGHMMIAHAHDPDYQHLENGGVMSDNTIVMRDSSFFRWHKYVDLIFDTYKQTLPPYQVTEDEFALSWPEVQIANISVQSTTSGSRPNVLQTFFMQSHADLSRGLDLTRTDLNRLGPIWLKFSHLNHDPFNYSITVRNTSNSNLRATVRIFLAPRLNEHGEQFVMTQQRKLFFEMDKFTQQLRPGENMITRRSADSALTIPWEQTFRDLERGVAEPSAQQSICGCGWPQHMLLPRGKPAGQIFDLLVFLTNADDDAVSGATPPAQGQCREALVFCGRLNQPYPDKKPMGYPFDRTPYAPQGSTTPVQTLEQYVAPISNMRTIQVNIIHDATRKEIRSDGGPTGVREISGDPFVNTSAPICPDQGQMPQSESGGRRDNQRPMKPTGTSSPGTGSQSSSPSSSPQQGRRHWSSGNDSRRWGGSYHWGHGGDRRRPSSPKPGQGYWGRRPHSPNWGWSG